MPCYCYMLECGDGSYYCGWTNDLEKRIAAHQTGKGGRYTRAHLPVKLVYYETFDSRSEAMQRENSLKRMNHLEKKKLVDGTVTKNE